MDEDKSDRLEAKVDSMQGTIDRMSKQMDDYLTQRDIEYVPGTKNAVVGKGDDDIDDFKQDFSKDENEERGNWSGQLDFLLACVGYAVGLGNVWRFPYLCYRNGGAVFFIPYVIMLVFVGIPIFLLELSLGQFSSSGPINCWELAPIFKGLGVGMVIVSAMVAIYYNMIIGWALYYLFASFTSELPWEECDPDWGSDYCIDFLHKTNGTDCLARGLNKSANGVCYLWERNNNTGVYGIWNTTLARDEHNLKAILPAEDYLYREVWHEHETDGMDDLGGLRWQLVLCYLLAWIIVCLCLIKGIKSSGKVVYFTALFPYVVLIILLIRGVTLDGHREGIKFYIEEVDWSKLEDAQVWKDAAVQIFFSLSASWGGLIALASYNRFHNDCVRDTLVICITNCLTSFFAGFVVFSFLGFLAHELDTEVQHVVKSGIGLAFTVYPAAVVKMPVSPLWAILFFLMLITLGLDTEFALMETVTTATFDQWPQLRKRKGAVILGFGAVLFLLGLTLCTKGGGYMLQLLDNYAGGWNLLFIAFLECFCVAYVYGYCRFKEDIRCMVGNTPCGCVPWNNCYGWWAVCWYFFTPAGVLFIMLFALADSSPLKWDEYRYPDWAVALGWLITLVVLVAVFVTAIIMTIIHVCVKKKPFINLLKPSKKWGPALVKHRRLMGNYLHESQFVLDPFSDRNAVDMDSYKNPELGGDSNNGYEHDYRF